MTRKFALASNELLLNWNPYLFSDENSLRFTRIRLILWNENPQVN
jgi:hypothetical protein